MDAFVIEPTSDAAAKGVVSEHWPKVLKAAGFSDEEFQADWKSQTSEFLEDARKAGLKPQTFVARDNEGKCLASIHCQIWAGPIPWVVQPHVFRLGTVWGLRIDEVLIGDAAFTASIRAKLLQAALGHLQEAQCSKVVTLAPTEDDKEHMIASNVGFQAANMLTLDLLKDGVWKEDSPTTNGKKPFLCSAVGTQHDATVCSHWRLMWQDVGIPQDALMPDMEQVTLAFIEQARERLSYQTFLARCSETQKVIGTVSCQVWEGPFPTVVKPEAFQMGTVWAVYVDPAYRRQGVATELMKLALRHLRAVGCHAAILIAASQGGQCVYEQLGFRPNKALVCDLQKPATKDKTDKAAVDGELLAEEKKQEESPETIRQDMQRAMQSLDLAVDSKQVVALCTATTQQLLAVYCDHPKGDAIIEAVTSVQRKFGIFVDPQDNWFTQRLANARATSFGGGFDMRELSDPSVLASKFDRLSKRYDHWTVGNRSKVESFVVRCARENSSVLSDAGKNARVLDVACGIGLQGQVLRMCGFQGVLVGTDISSGMVKRVMERGCYDHAHVSNANVSLSSLDKDIEQHQLCDVVICTGAMELLDHKRVLGEISKMTKPGGEVWVSFQHDKETPNPTQHQHVQGVSKEQALCRLKEAGFREVAIEACPDAFYTPSPDQDGTLLPVPYLFILARKEA